MKNAPRDGEDVPDRVEVLLRLDDVEHDPARVADPADKQKPQRQRRAVPQHRLNRENHRPAHKRVADYRGLAEFLEVYGVHHDSENRRAPDYPEQHPPDRSAQRNKRYRSVRPGDEEENRVVIHNAEKAFRAPVCNRVVQRRHRVQNNERRAVNRRAYDLPSPAVDRGKHNQHRRPGNRQQRPHAVRNGVENLLTQRIALCNINSGGVAALQFYFIHKSNLFSLLLHSITLPGVCQRVLKVFS